MEDRLIKPYEISVWEDKLVIEYEESATNTQTEPKIKNTYYEEIKIATIGSNTMEGYNKVYEPVFTKKTNGEKTLSFSLKYQYFDPYIGATVVNPFASYLINERKVKLYYDNEWYDFLIKEHSESSDGLVWTYTATDAFVNELSKNGYDKEFDIERNNNQGTAIDLAKAVVEGTDWQVDEENSSVGPQEISEAIYNAILTSTTGITIVDAETGETPVEPLEAKTEIYLFYNYVANQDGNYVQFILKEDNPHNYQVDSNNTIKATNYRIMTPLIFRDDCFVDSNQNPIITFTNIDVSYHAYRKVYDQLSTYDPVLKRTVKRYELDGLDSEIYGYTDYIYSTSDIVTNFITNGENFNTFDNGTLQGWAQKGAIAGTEYPQVNLVTYPAIESTSTLTALASYTQIEGYMEVKFPGIFNDYQNGIFNSGIEDSARIIGSISAGQEFVFRWRGAVSGTKHGTLSQMDKSAIRVVVAKYRKSDKQKSGSYYNIVDKNNIILEFNTTAQELDNYITGGIFNEDYTAYSINAVTQEPSTKYIYQSTGTDYIWDARDVEHLKYVPLESEKPPFFPHYYYMTATAQRSISEAELAEPSTNIGIFIYINKNVNNYYYFQDIQLTRLYRDANNKIITIGNIPVATATPIEYFYVQPDKSMAAENVEVYTKMAALASALGTEENNIKPIYNKNSTKYLSINESHSNCYNLLQTIAETFECWVDLKVEHNDNGSIKLTDGKPNKKIVLQEFVGKDNSAGFRYGVNLNTIERTINSDEIVTKLYVTPAQSDYTDEGSVAIGYATMNPSGEQFILNFDYYYNQGLIANADDARGDVQAYYDILRTINKELKAQEKQRENLESAVNKLNSQRNIYSNLIDEAKNNIDTGETDFKDLTGRTYDEYRTTKSQIVDLYYFLSTDEQVRQHKDYFVLTSGTGEDKYKLVSKPTGNPQQKGYYEYLPDLESNNTIIDIIAKIYTNSYVVNNYTGILTNIEQEYRDKRRTLRGSEEFTVSIGLTSTNSTDKKLKVIVSDYITPFIFTVNGQQYKTDLNTKTFEITTPAPNITINTILDGYTLVDAKGNLVEGTIVPSLDKIIVLTLKPDVVFDGVEDVIEKLLEDKKQAVELFNNKYNRFIQEGTWSSTDYIDSNLYYLDALSVSNTSAQPQVTYSISVVEVSELENLEGYRFDVGDKTYIEDTEFFGWTEVGGILTPAREEVIVSEVEWHLEEPENNVITVQNYKTRFEDLFQRISAAVQTVQYNEATYAKTSSLMDAYGALSQTILLDSLNNISGQPYTLTSDGSVRIDGDRITIRNMQEPAYVMTLESTGLRISSDGGKTWSTAVSGRGINLEAVLTSMLNTDKIIIGNKDNPSFRWDQYGISAYKRDTENNVYDLNTYVRFDQYGLYGISSDRQGFVATNLEDVKNKASFAVTWDGFFIKNSYPGGGQVSLTSDNDFQVLNTVDGVQKEKIKIGALEWGKNGDIPIISPDAAGATEEPTLYGIRINNNAGDTVFKTGDDGNITITGTINANAGDFKGWVAVGDRTQDPLENPWIVISGGATEASKEAYGSKATIRTSNYQDGAGYGWMINSDGDAVFNNITARGAIKTAVFEYAEIQAVGGIFIFRPSSTIRNAERVENSDDIKLTLEKPYLFKIGDWCKISNYTDSTDEPQATSILSNNGLTHVYKIKLIDPQNSRIVVLENAYNALVVNSNTKVISVLTDLIGGALIDMGDSANGNGKVGSSNYGIGINSSDNTVNLPRRAISLFETIVDTTKSPKVSYNYRGILGTLPPLPAGQIKDGIYNQYMAGTQGIYTDNMYIGDKTQYIAFYTDSSGKHLKISAQEMIFSYDEDTGKEITWEDKIEEASKGTDAAQVVLTSTIGDRVSGGVERGAVYARLFIGNQEQDLLKTNVFNTTPPESGEYYYHLDATNKTCTLKKKVDNSWIDASSEESSIYTYTWTFRDSSGQSIKYNGLDSITGKAIYIDKDIVNSKIIIQCDVNDNN